MKILEGHELIEPGVFIRPLVLVRGEDSTYTTNTRSGDSNTFRWAPVEAVLHPSWMNRLVSEYLQTERLLLERDGVTQEIDTREFARDVPVQDQRPSS